MSTDWQVSCAPCRISRHLGQEMGGLNTFGYGSSDVAGRNGVGEFIAEHFGAWASQCDLRHT